MPKSTKMLLANISSQLDRSGVELISSQQFHLKHAAFNYEIQHAIKKLVSAAWDIHV